MRLPDDRPAHTAALLRAHAAGVLTGLRPTYETSRGGWFTADDGRARVEHRLGALTEAIETVRYSTAIESTGLLVRHACLAGASMLERVTFPHRSCQALLRVVDQSPDGRHELPAARRRCAALRPNALRDVDR